MKKETARLGYLEIEEYDVASRKDARKKVDRMTYSYFLGRFEWRRAFEIERGSRFDPPPSIEVTLD